MTDDRDGVRLRFDSVQVDLGMVRDAEEVLRAAGVQFDTGMDVGGHPVRDWFLDGVGDGYHVEPWPPEEAADD